MALLAMLLAGCGGSTGDNPNPGPVAGAPAPATPSEPTPGSPSEPMSGPAEPSPAPTPEPAPVPSPEPPPPPVGTAHILVWDYPEDVPMAGFYVYWGLKGPIFTPTQWRMVTVKNFDLMAISFAPGIYQFGVTAYDADGNESDFSNIIEWISG